MRNPTGKPREARRRTRRASRVCRLAPGVARSSVLAELLALDGVPAVVLVTVGRRAVELVVALVVTAGEVLVTVVVHGHLVLGVVPRLVELLAGRLLDVLREPEVR